MDRYWRELDGMARACQERDGRGWQYEALVDGPPVGSRRAGRLARAWHRYVMYPARAMMMPRVDVVHLLDHSHARVLPWLERKGKRVVTVHDLVPLRDGTGLTVAQVERFRRDMLEMRRADFILADSDFTAGEVRGLLGAECPPMQTLLLGVDAARFQQQAERLPEWLANLAAGVPVCLCVGSGLARKNLRILPALLGEVLREIPRLVLLKVGPAFEAELGAAVRALAPALEVVEVPQASEAELVAAYQRADVLLFPSLLEGFGLPVLEAMAAGTPVVASNASSIPEVGLDACRYFDPQDATAGAREVVAVLSDEGLRAELIARGLSRAAALDWSVHFQKLCAIYGELAAKSEPRVIAPSANSLRLRKLLHSAVVAVARAIGSPIHDAETGENLGRALVLAWGGRVHVIGLAVPVRAVFLRQSRITYWRQQIGFTKHAQPDYERERPNQT